MTSLIALIAMTTPSPVLTPLQQPNDGLWHRIHGTEVTQFTVDGHAIDVYLPDEMMGGDQISGAVFSRLNDDRLELQVGGKSVKVNNRGFTFQIGSDATDVHLVILRDGVKIEDHRIALKDGTFFPRAFQASPVVTTGASLYIAGHFDGNRNNTMLELNGRKMGVLTESPRAATVSVVGLGLGRNRVSVEEGSHALEQGFNVVDVKLLSEKLGRGKQKMKYQLSGLESVDQSAFPLAIVLQTDTPDAIEFENKNTIFVSRANYEEVQNGRYLGDVPVKTHKGSFRVTALALSETFVKQLQR